MRALGPGSVSSFLKIILDVVFVALWIGLGAVALMMLAALLFSFNPDLIDNFSIRAGDAEIVSRGPVLLGGLAAAGLYLAGVLVIVERLRKIFATLTAGDPFHPENVRRLRVIGLVLAGLEIGRYVIYGLGMWALPDADIQRPEFSPTAWFSVLVVFVLAEVFREGARLRREAELTI
ncbi:MAG: DUF2975 domain-containing protein [Pseudomonadota bacterium]|uniref:DUF2975 domain-containing protein n=1 Tax=Phenylobacterium sp. TaxID=1871053 RepID=UPI0027214C5A|nr:DUF2975 domain-containing protein [Phenylobacterium sp.]MDO9430429.1 DUF2975 domain-containing protein [Phenylobacterium sp.]